MSVLRAVCFVVFAGTGTALHVAPVPPTSSSARPGATVDVDRFGVERVESLAPGVPLRFSLYGSSGARVLVAVDGAAAALPLHETRPGMYEGEYVIGPRDRIDARSHATATVERDGVVARAPLAEPLLLERGSVPWAGVLDTATPATFSGAPHPADPVLLSPPPAAWPSSALPPRAVGPAATLPSPAADTSAPSSATACADCATVRSIVPLPPMPHDVLGGLAGAVAGAAAANAASDDHARRVLRVVGAAAGYIVGGELARRLTRQAGYDVVLRLQDGSTLRRRYDAAPAFRVGDTVSLSATSTATRPGSL